MKRITEAKRFQYRFSRYSRIYQNCHIGIWTLVLKRIPAVVYVPYNTKGSKLSLFSLYGHRFPRYASFVKIAIFRHETWNLKKGPEVAYGTSFYPNGSKLSSSLLYWQRFWATSLYSKCYIWAWNVDLKKVPEVAYGLSFYPRGMNIELFFFCPMALIFQIGTDFQNYHTWACILTGMWKTFKKLHIDPLSASGVRNWAYFRSTDTGFSEQF